MITSTVDTRDENCAHCVLGHDLAVFLAAHPEKCRTELIQELLQIVAEVTAVSVPRDGLIGYSIWLQRRLSEEIRAAVDDIEQRGQAS